MTGHSGVALAAHGYTELVHALIRNYPEEQHKLGTAIDALLTAAEAGPYAERQFLDTDPRLSTSDLNGTLDWLPEESQVAFVNATAFLMFHGADGPRGTAASLRDLLTTMRTKLGANDGS